MHDTDTASPSLQHATVTQTTPPHVTKKEVSTPVSVADIAAPRGLLAKVLRFFARLFAGKKQEMAKPVVVATSSDVERAAVSRAALMPPPVAFIGNTASTVATPIGSYAGKPVDHVIRKRAEQQFKNMDLRETTKH